MKNAIKKIVTLALCICMMSTFVIGANAAPAAGNKDDEYWRDLSGRTGIPVADLQNSYMQMNEEEFINAVSELEGLMEYYKSLPGYGVSEADASPMPDVTWRNFKNTMVNGSVLITQDSEHLDYYHGHAAIVSGVYGSQSTDPLERVIYITEHPGSKDNSALSWRIILNNSTTNFWRIRKNVVNMYYNPSSTVMNNAGVTATRDHVIGKPYNPVVNKTSTTAFSCSSLVYRCYLDNGADIGGTSGSVVMPVHIAQDTDMIVRFLYGNFPW